MQAPVQVAPVQVQPHTSPRPGPSLVPAPAAKPTPLALWHLLSLDAPTVAALWTLFLARTAGVPLRWQSPAAMFVAVWMIYAADRLLDSRSLPTWQTGNGPLENWPTGKLATGRPTAPHLEARHHFHHRHRTAFLLAIALASVLLTALLHTLAVLAPLSLHLYALLATLLAAYLVLIHARAGSHRLPKEFAVGVFFSAAVFVPTVARAPRLQAALLPAAVLLAATCTLNCLYIYAWEHKPIPLAANDPAHWTTRWATRHLAHLSAGLLLAAAAASLADPLVRLPALACALSALLLLALDTFRRRLSAVHLRAAADLALLTPLLLLRLR